MVTKQDYKDALLVQDACNLSGVVFAFAQTMQRICDEAHAQGQGTAWRNNHPICRLFAEQILYLTGGGAGTPSTYFPAHDACEANARE